MAKAEPVLDVLRMRPGVHWLCRGAFLQHVLPIEQDVAVVPLGDFGFGAEAKYVAQYAHEVAKVPVDGPAVENLQKSCEHTNPVVAIACRSGVDGEPQQIETACQTKMQQARRILAWATGNEITPFGVLTMSTANAWFKLLPPGSARRHRLGFGNTGRDFTEQIERIVALLQTSERYAFATALYHDALREDDPQFKIARMYNCLEAFAANLKGPDRGSRDAVRYMLGVEGGAKDRCVTGGVDYQYDRIALAGRLRDKLFHGASFTPQGLPKQMRGGFDLIEQHPDALISGLMSDCELEISRWANDASRARAASEGRDPEDL